MAPSMKYPRSCNVRVMGRGSRRWPTETMTSPVGWQGSTRGGRSLIIGAKATTQWVVLLVRLGNSSFWRVLWLAVCALTLPWDAASSASVSVEHSRSDAEVVLEGNIAPGDAHRLLALVDAAASEGRKPPVLRLNSLGGTFGESLKIVEVVKTFGLTTLVSDGGRCVSACFIVFAAGREKVASYGAWIGVHKGTDNGRETWWARAATADMADEMRKLGVPAPIIVRMRRTPNERVAWLSSDDLRSMGVRMTGRPSDAPLLLRAPTLEDIDRKPLSLPSWDEAIGLATSLSAQQNGGAGKVTHSCSTTGICRSTVFYFNRNGDPSLLETARDKSGAVTARKACDFSDRDDEWRCAEWAP